MFSGRQYLPAFVAIALGMGIVGCSDSDDNDDDNGGGMVGSDSPLYVVKSTDWSTDDGLSLVYVTDSLDTETVFDPEQALALAGYHYVSTNQTGDGDEMAFHLAVDNTARLERYIVADDGSISKDPNELDFSALGIADMRNAMRSGLIHSAETGYFLDFATMQAVVFNPTDMTITTSIDLSEHIEAEYPNRWSIFPVIDGDRVVVPVTFYDADYAPTALSKLVIYDTTTDEVTVDSSTQCGSLSRSAVDADGNVYWASSHDIAVGHALDASASFADDQPFAPCMIRMAAGADGWDDDYYVDLTSLTEDGRPAHAIMTGSGDVAYTAIFDPSEFGPVSEDNARANVWAFHSVELGNEEAGVTAVPNAIATNHRPSFGSFINESNELVGWMQVVNDDYTETTVWDGTDPDNWTVLTTVPGQLETIERLR